MTGAHPVTNNIEQVYSMDQAQDSTVLVDVQSDNSEPHEYNEW